MNQRGKLSRAFVAALFFFPIVSTAQGQRAIPDDNLAMPVLVQVPQGAERVAIGSGFYLNAAKSMYFVTARHVLYAVDKNGALLVDRNNQPLLRAPLLTLTSYSGDPKNTGKNVVVLDLNELRKAAQIDYHRVADVAAIRIGSFVGDAPGQPAGHKATAFSAGVTEIERGAGSLWGADIVTGIKKYDDVLISNPVVIFGYPNSVGTKDQLDLERPLLRGGIVSGKNPTKKVLVIDAQMHKGNSGGPVVEVSREGPATRFTIIGVVVEFVPYPQLSDGLSTLAGNSGYSIAVPMDFVLDLIE